MRHARLGLGKLALTGALVLAAGCVGGTMVGNYTVSGMDPFYDSYIRAPRAFADARGDSLARDDDAGIADDVFRDAAYLPALDGDAPFADGRNRPQPF